MNPDFLPQLESALARGLTGFDRISSIQRLTGGASLQTWAIDAIVDGAPAPLILRRSTRSARAHALPLATEAAVIERAREAGVRAPRVRHVLTEADGAGEGYVMDRLAGETLARRILRDAAFDAVRPLLAHQCGELLARIHAVPTAPLAALLPATDGPALLDRYRSLYDSYDCPHPVFELAFRWLGPRLRPAQRTTLVHGDFRNGNLLISPNGVEAALDWELTHLGDPVQDLGWLCVNSWRFGVSDKVVGGFGDLPDLLAGYASAGGGAVAPEEVLPWIAFGSLSWGIMCMGMYQESRRDGSVERAAIGRRSSEAEIDLLNIIIHGKM